ncbi:MAG: DUF3987 domain-containing protein [Deltaproteobacteria bacterium]|nr:DUF3987 domain-containing protein [Deltaproteobacteria bacterium]
MQNVRKTPQEWATLFARRGWPVIPIHYPIGKDQCSCRKPVCASTAKHPMTPNGLKNASRGAATVLHWWEETPNANIGILTGQESGLVVLDIDPRHGGDESLAKLESENRRLPETLKVKTGGNGWHYYFRHPGGKIPNKANLRSGLDIRGDGGYIIAPPSTHANLQTYMWVEPDLEPAPLPEWLHSLMISPAKSAPKTISANELLTVGFSEGTRNGSLMSVAGFLKSKGLDQGAITKALASLNQNLCHPPLSADEVLQIATSVGRYEEKEWSEPSDLPSVVTAPEMSLEMLPSTLQAWCSDIAERMQVPLEFAAGPAIVTIASLLGRKVVIYPKTKDDWQVIPNLWGCLIAPPGSMKSPAMSAVLKPLHNLAVKARGEFLEESKRIEAAKAVAKAEIDALKDALKASVRQGNQTAISQKKEALANAIKKFDETCQITERRYLMNDPTIEKLLTIIQENPQGLLLYRDELSGWLETMYKSGREGDREFFLEAWNGDTPYSMDRISRGSVFVDGLCLSVLGGLQPSKFQSYVASLVKGGKSDDGLLQRFQILLCPEKRKVWKKIDRAPNTDAAKQVETIFNALAKLPLPRRKEAEIERLSIRFTSSAQEIADRWRENLETRLLSGTISPVLESHLSKYRSLMPSLALIFEVTDSLCEGDFPCELRKESTDLAIKWCEFLEKHARKAYGEFLEPDIVAGRCLLAKIKAGAVKDFDRCRDIYRHGWKGLATQEELEGGITTLRNFGWVRTEMIFPPTGRRFEIVRLHPSLRLV